MAEGRFREDLYYRLNVILIRLPDLHERSEDIPLLVEHFIERFNQRMGRNIKGVTDEAMAVLMRYPFPGNVRELENMLEHAYIVTRGPQIGPTILTSHLLDGRRIDPSPPPLQGSPWRNASSDQREAERLKILGCLERNLWSIPRAARELGMHRTTLWRKVKKLDLRRP